LKSLYKVTARPRLKTPNLLAVWPGVSNVAMIVATYLLQKKAGFKPLAVIDAAYFFDPIGILARNGVVESPQFPQSRFYYWKNKAGGDDIILFIGDDQPSSKAYEMASCVLDVGVRFHMKKLYTCAAAMTRIHHAEQPGVYGVATSQEAAEELKQYDMKSAGNMQIAGLNGLLLGVAKERKIEGVCLLGEVPSYASRMQNPMAALSVIKVLMQCLDIEVDISDLAHLARETGEGMKQLASQAMGEYIDYFTEPIWERDDDEEDEEEEEY